MRGYQTRHEFWFVADRRQPFIEADTLSRLLINASVMAYHVALVGEKIRGLNTDTVRTRSCQIVASTLYKFSSMLDFNVRLVILQAVSEL